MWGVISLVVTIVFTLFGITQKRLNNMDERLRGAPSREEVKAILDMKQELNNAHHEDLKEDIKEIKEQLNLLLSKLVS